MTEGPEKLAVVLRGPPCTGKSTIGCKLATWLGAPAVVVLDERWGHGELRHRLRGIGRYPDLDSNAPVLVIELGVGEPADGSSRGASRDPMEWVEILEDAGRRVWFFMLWASEDVLVERAKERERKRGEPWVDKVRAICAVYRQGELSNTAFEAQLDGRKEETLDTGAATEEFLVDCILVRVRGRA